jgi:hypothetical protein
MNIKNLIKKIFNKNNVVPAVVVSTIAVGGLQIGGGEPENYDEPLTLAMQDREYARSQGTFLLAATPASMRWTWDKSDQYVGTFAIDKQIKKADARREVLNDQFFCDNANADYIVDLIRLARKKARESNKSFDFCYKSEILGTIQEEDQAHQQFIKELDQEMKEKTPKDLRFKKVKLMVD